MWECDEDFGTARVALEQRTIYSSPQNVDSSSSSFASGARGDVHREKERGSSSPDESSTAEFVRSSSTWS